MKKINVNNFLGAFDILNSVRYFLFRFNLILFLFLVILVPKLILFRLVSKATFKCFSYILYIEFQLYLN